MAVPLGVCLFPTDRSRRRATIAAAAAQILRLL